MEIRAVATIREHDGVRGHARRPFDPGRWLRHCRVGWWQSIAATALLVIVAFGRAPLRAIPDALFVSDGFGYYVYLPSVVIDHDLDFANQFVRVPFEAAKSYFDPIPRTGLRANPFPVGCAVLWSPFFLAAHGAITVLHALGANVRTDGFGFGYELPVYWGAFFYGLLGAWLTQILIRDLFSRAVTDQVMCALVLCSPFAYYLLIEPDVSHVNAAFSTALFVFLLWRAMRNRDARFGTWIGVGASLGLVALIRPYNGLLALATLPAVWFVGEERRVTLGGRLLRLGICAAAALAAFMPQIAASTLLYGALTWLPPGTGYERMAWTHPNFAALAVSLFSFFPLLVLGFVGLFPAGRVPPAGDAAAASDQRGREMFLRYVVPCLFVALLGVMYVTASYPRGSTFGDSFGQRRIVDWAVVIALGLASVFARVPARWQRGLGWTLIAAAAADVVVAALYIVKVVPPWGGTALLGLG